MVYEEKVTEVTKTPQSKGVSTTVYAARLVSFIVGIIIGFIVVRMILLFLGANSGNAFVDFIYSVSGFFVAPFYGMFNNTPTFGTSVLDVSSIVAIIVYALIGWAMIALITLGRRDHDQI